MKKFSLILALLLVFGLAAFAGEPSVSGTFGSQINFDDSTDNGNIGKLRLNVAIPVGDFIDVTMDLRDDSNSVDSFTFNQAYVTTDISGALGLDMVALTLRMGIYAEWISNWNSPTSTNRARVVETFAVGGTDDAPDVGLDIGVGSYGTIKTYMQTDAVGSNDLAYKVGFILGDVVDGLNAALSYSGGTLAATNYSYFKAEAGYDLALGDGMTLTIPAGFITDLEAQTMQFGFGAKFSGFGLSLGVGGKMTDATTSTNMEFTVLDAQLAYAVMDTGVSIYGNMFGSPSDENSTDFLESLDFGLSYDMAGNMMYVGYVADLGNDVTTTPLMMDDSTTRHGVVGNGFYITSVVSF